MSQAAVRTVDTLPPDFIPESELVHSDGVPLDTSFQRKQINLSADVIQEGMAEQECEDYYVGGNMFVYYSAEQARAIAREVQLSLFPVSDEGTPEHPPLKKHNKGPDVFVVRGGVEQRKRKVWASWLEGGRLPDLIFEVQSVSTADVDANEKKRFYAEVFKSREYFYYGANDPKLGKCQDVLVGLRLNRRGFYEPIETDERGWMWSEVLGFYMGRWDGLYDQEKDRWIRLYDTDGRLIPTAREAAEARAETASRHRLEAEQRAETEHRQRQEERRHREAAEQRATDAEAEVARLKKLLRERDSS